MSYLRRWILLIVTIHVYIGSVSSIRCTGSIFDCFRAQSSDQEIESNVPNPTVSNPLHLRSRNSPVPNTLANDASIIQFTNQTDGSSNCCNIMQTLVHSHNIQIPTKKQRAQYLDKRFKMRKRAIANTVNNLSIKDTLAAKEQHKHAKSFLLILNGQNTIFYMTNIPSPNSDTARILNNTEALAFRSSIHEHKLIVIRPGFIDLLHRLHQINDQLELPAVLYTNEVMKGDVLDELISTLTFIELYFKYHCNYHKILRFELLLTQPDHKPKTLPTLIQYVPLALYEKLVIIDHLGLRGWQFSEEFVSSRRTPAFLWLQKQIIPIQPKALDMNATDMNHVAHDVSYVALCSKIDSYCNGLPSGTGFVDHWIVSDPTQKKGQARIRLMSLTFGDDDVNSLRMQLSVEHVVNVDSRRDTQQATETRQRDNMIRKENLLSADVMDTNKWATPRRGSHSNTLKGRDTVRPLINRAMRADISVPSAVNSISSVSRP
eukprot:230906_1